MAFLTGLLQIEAPASALNNLGKIEGAVTDNAVGVKQIKTREGAYPYVSAQALRYWLRETLSAGEWGWKAAPVYRERKVAYTDANPIEWWDDDLFGYMRAPSKRTAATEARGEDAAFAQMTETKETVTRVSPFRVGTMVSLAPASVVSDFGVMTRGHEGDPVPFEHEFYRATLQSLLSLDLHAAGTFSYLDKSGYLNLDEIRQAKAKTQSLEHLEKEKCYRLPLDERLQRIRSLLEALASLDGGAKQSLHYTDVSPDILLFAVTKGGNNLFGHVFGAYAKGQPFLRLEALKEALTVHQEEILSPIYWGWVNGYLDEERKKLATALATDDFKALKREVILDHPILVIKRLVADLTSHPDWLK